MSPAQHPAPPNRPFVGVILLDTRFPRPLGDIGQPDTFAQAGLPVRLLRVPRASVQRVVREADPALLVPFIEAAKTLEHEGAALITTSCGFLAQHQQALQAAVGVPMISSSLLQCAGLNAPGIVTFDADSLAPTVLAGAGVPAGTPVSGLQAGCCMQRTILHDLLEMDLSQAENDVVQAALRLVQQHPQVRHIVLECTNMPPYRNAVARATGRPVFDLETLLLQQWPLALARRG